LYYTASGIVTPIGGRPVPTLHCRFKNVWHVCHNYCGCVLNVICVFMTDVLFYYAKNLIQNQENESQCSQSAEDRAQNLDKALVPVTYSCARTCKIIKFSSIQGYCALSNGTQISSFSA